MNVHHVAIRIPQYSLESTKEYLVEVARGRLLSGNNTRVVIQFPNIQVVLLTGDEYDNHVAFTQENYTFGEIDRAKSHDDGSLIFQPSLTDVGIGIEYLIRKPDYERG